MSRTSARWAALRKKIPFTAAMMAIGTIALTGFPFTAGFYSKDAIIEAAYVAHQPGHVYAFICVVLAAFMTSFYSWRLFFLTFWARRALTNTPMTTRMKARW